MSDNDSFNKKVDTIDDFFKIVKKGLEENFLSMGEAAPMVFAFKEGESLFIFPVPIDDENDKEVIAKIIASLRGVCDAVAFATEIWMKSFDSGDKPDLGRQVSTYEDRQEALMATFYIKGKTIMNINHIDRTGDYTKCLGWESMDGDATLRGRFS